MLPGYLEFGIEEIPEAAPIRRHVAGFLVRWGYHAEALPLLREIRDAQPGSILCRCWLCECLAAEGHLEEACSVLAPLADAHPESHLVATARAALLLRRGAAAEARAAGNEILAASSGRCLRAWELLSECHLAEGAPAEALATCRCHAALARQRAPDTETDGYPARYLCLLARVQAACGHADEANRTIDTAAEVEAAEAEKLNRLVRAGRPAEPALAEAHPVDADDPGLPADALRADLRRVFGYAHYLPGQREVIGQVMAGQDVLATLPTGGGKSLCYQLPVLRLPGSVVIISPLIALMRDQVAHLPREVARLATVINHTIDSREMAARLDGIARRRYRLVYAAPERLRQEPFLHALRSAGVSLFVVDEAHCVSLWGHDFRPDYAFIGPALAHLSRPTLLGLTATATARVRNEIEESLCRRLVSVNLGISRPNLWLGVRRCANDGEKLSRLAREVADARGPAIVYARAKATCESIAHALRGEGIAAIHYHAGLAPEERERAQQEFMEGRARVVCATVAFGMGIDKPDIRLVAHYNLPKSVENYWQEAGRAGRDGLPARCILFATRADAERVARLAAEEAVRTPLVEQVLQALREMLGGPGPGRIVFDDLLREAPDEEETAIRAALALLERVGLIRRFLDIPRTVTLCATESGDAGFARFVSDVRLRPGQRNSLDAGEVCERAGIPLPDLESRLLGWRDGGHLQFHTSGRDLLLSVPEPPAGAASALAELLRENRHCQAERSRRMRAYAAVHACRHAFIAGIFGEKSPVPCGACDICTPAVWPDRGRGNSP